MAAKPEKFALTDFKFLTLTDTNVDAAGRKVRVNAGAISNYYPSQTGDGTCIVNMNNGDSFVVAESADTIDLMVD